MFVVVVASVNFVHVEYESTRLPAEGVASLRAPPGLISTASGGTTCSAVQGIGFVGPTSEVCHPQPLCNFAYPPQN